MSGTKRRLPLLAAALALGWAAEGLAEPDFPALDTAELRRAVTEYRRKAALLRKSVGLRDRRISEAESRASEIIQDAETEVARRQQAALEAQRRAESGKAGLDFAASLLGQFGGNSFLSSAVQTGMRTAGQANLAAASAGTRAAMEGGADDVRSAHAAAVPLQQEAKALEGDKKKLALKAQQYERLADAKDLLLAAETLRRQAEELGRGSESGDKPASAYRSLVERMDVW